MQEIRKDFYEGAITRKILHDKLLDHVVKCEEYIGDTKVTIFEISESERDKYYDGSIDVLELLNKHLSRFFYKGRVVIIKKCLGIPNKYFRVISS